MRYEIYADDGNLDMNKARELLAANCARNIREAYRDMDTWWGTNQPRVIAFTLEDEMIAHETTCQHIVERYRNETGRRAAIETRRTRRTPGKSRLVALA